MTTPEQKNFLSHFFQSFAPRACVGTYTAPNSECAVPEKIHTHPEEGHWKFLEGGGGGGRS